MTQLLHPQGKRPWYPLDRRLGGLQCQPGCGGRRKIPSPYPSTIPLSYPCPLKIANKSRKLQIMGMAITTQNYINKEIKSRLNSGNTYYHSVQNILSSHKM
jgi:hypothetical protein